MLHAALHTSSAAHPVSYLKGRGGVLSQGVRQPDLEADHSQSSSYKLRPHPHTPQWCHTEKNVILTLIVENVKLYSHNHETRTSHNLCIFIVMFMYSYCLFMYLHRASWHSSATLTEVFPCFLFSCKANARVKPAKTGHGPHYSKLLCCCSIYCLFCVVLYVVCV